MSAFIYFRHPPAGYEMINVDITERFASPISHAQNYNLERARLLYNGTTLSSWRGVL